MTMTTTTMPPVKRRSTRDRRPVERLIADTSGNFQSTPQNETNAAPSNNMQNTATNADVDGTSLIALEAPVTRRKKRRLSNNYPVAPSSESSSSQQAVSLIAISRQVRLKVAPKSLVPKEHEDTPLIAYLSKPLVATPISNTKKKRKKDVPVSQGPSSSTKTPVSRPQQDVRICFTQCSSISKDLAATPLIGTLPVAEAVAVVPKKKAPAVTTRKRRKTQEPPPLPDPELDTAMLPFLPPLPLTQQETAVLSSEFPASSSATTTPGRNNNRRKKRRGGTPKASSISRRPSPGDTGMLPPVHPATPLTRQSSIPKNAMAATPAAALQTPQQSFLSPTCFQTPNMSSAFETPRSFPTPRSSTGSLPTPKSSGQRTLTTLTTRFYNHIITSGNVEVNLTDVCNELGTPKRRIYDVVNVLEGAGILERAKDDETGEPLGKHCGTWRLTPLVLNPRTNPQVKEAHDQVTRLAQEEAHLDAWIHLLQQWNSDRNPYGYISSQQLACLRDEDSILLAIATPADTILHRPKETYSDDGSHSFSLAPSDESRDEAFLPQVFLMESAEEMRKLCLIPPPDLFSTRCCSDFSVNALNHGGMLQQVDATSPPAKDFMTLTTTTTTPSPPSPPRPDEPMIATPTSVSFDTNLAAEALTELAIPTQLLRHESFGIMDKTEPLPPVPGEAEPLASSPPATSSSPPDENSEPFQYPWLKGKKVNSKYAPKRSTGGLLCDSEEPSPERTILPRVPPYPDLNDACLPRRSLHWNDEPLPPATMVMQKISADLAPMPTLLHECTSLVLWND